MLLGTTSGKLEYVVILNMATFLLAAFKVATIGNKSGWTHLKKDDAGIWRGDVDTGEAGNEIQLCAAFEEESNSYSMLLSYTVRHSLTTMR